MSGTLDVRLFWYAFLLYLGAFLAFSLYGATRGRRTGWVANGLIAAGFVLQSAAVLWRWKLSGHAPMSNMFEYATLLSWMAVLSYLWIALKYRRTIVGSFVAPVVVALMTCASLLPKDIHQQLVPALQSYWLAIHVSLAALGEGAFAVAFAVSIMYLVQDARQQRRAGAQASGKVAALRARAPRAGLQLAAVGSAGESTVAVLDAEADDLIDEELREPSAGGARRRVVEESKGGRLPSLKLLDEINYRATAIGYPLYTIGALFAGAIWAYNAWGSFWSWDPKEVGAFIIWLFYTAYLHARMQRQWAGRRAAWLSVAGFVMVILSFLGNLWLGGNHAYQ
jgi:cytochrome c-type biogenesis protein CcsB